MRNSRLMRVGLLALLLTAPVRGQEAAEMKIVSPPADAFVSDQVTLEVQILRANVAAKSSTSPFTRTASSSAARPTPNSRSATGMPALSSVRI